MKFPAFAPIDLKNNTTNISVVELSLTQVIPDPNQPRKKFRQEQLTELAFSIKQQGIIQPIIVKKVDDEKYQIIAGERRWRASCIAGLEVIPAIIQTKKPQENIAISLIENIQREELNPIELAKAFHQLNNNHGLSHEAIAKMIGKSRATVTNLLRLLGLSAEVQELLINNELEMGHARSLLSLPCDHQVFLALKIVEKNLTVRDAEKLVQLYKLPQQKKSNPYAGEVGAWTKKLSDSLSAKVAININEKGEGRVVIHFSSPREVDWLVEQLEEEKNRNDP